MTLPESAGEAPKSRRWFVVLAIVTLIGLAIFTGAITVIAIRLPELKKQGGRAPSLQERTWLG